jgi:hypothetical protein
VNLTNELMKSPSGRVARAGRQGGNTYEQQPSNQPRSEVCISSKAFILRSPKVAIQGFCSHNSKDIHSTTTTISSIGVGMQLRLKGSVPSKSLKLVL